MSGLTIGSLFSGVGGLELGLEWAGHGPVLWQVEKDEYCTRVLEKHWPETERFRDVCAVSAEELEPVDLICGGFPCQDVSSAGARAGLTGKRSGLWREFARVVSELRPSWVVVENVTSGARLWVNAVVRELGRLTYEALPLPVRADALGAPYPRARIFVVARRLADGDGDGEHAVSKHDEVASESPHGLVAAGARQTANAHRKQLRQQPRRGSGPHREGRALPVVNRWREPMPRVDGVVPGPTRRLAQRAAGNCVVPQCAQVVGEVINLLRGAP